MRTRPALALALAGSVVLGGGYASAAVKPKPKPVCNLVSDAKGDATSGAFAPAPVLPNEPAVDIVSGDVATAGKVLTTVLRVDKLSTKSSTSPGGLHWKFFFSVNGHAFFTQAIAPADGPVTYGFGDIDPVAGNSRGLGDGTGKLDLAKNEVRVSIPLSGLTEPVKAGTKITDLAPNAGRFVGNDLTVTFSDSTDEATSAKTYVAGSLSCVKPG